MTAVLDIAGLTLAYRDAAEPAVSDVSLSIAPGEVVALVGESGSGKSTVALAVARLLPPATRQLAGEIRLLGTRLPEAGEPALRAVRAEELGYVFQNPISSLDPTMRIGRQLALAIPRASRADLVAALVAMRIPQPAEIMRRFPHQLSGGMAQRVGLAMAIGRQPRLLIVDEPTSALDPSLAVEMFEVLLEQRRSRGTSILMLSHDLSAVARHADRVAVMQAGRIVEAGPTAKLFAAPLHAYTRRLLQQNDAPVAAAAVTSDTIAAQLTQVTVRYPGSLAAAPSVALDDVSLSIRQGEVLGLIGESGSGKTTVGRLLLGLVEPSRGSVAIDGQSVRLLRPGSLGAVLQNPDWALNPRLPVGYSIAEPLRRHRLNRGQKAEAVGAALAAVGLPAEYARRFPGQLSGGQRQRVSIARALVARPTLMLFDEPVSALDALVQRQVIEEIARLHREIGFTALFISHDLDALRRVASRIAVLQAGRLIELSDAADFFAGPAHPYSRTLLAAAGLGTPDE